MTRWVTDNTAPQMETTEEAVLGQEAGHILTIVIMEVIIMEEEGAMTHVEELGREELEQEEVVEDSGLEQ